MKKLRDRASAHPTVRFTADSGRNMGGFGRNDYFDYSAMFGATGEVAPRVSLEAGTASCREPTVDVEIQSLLAEFPQARAVSLDAQALSS